MAMEVKSSPKRLHRHLLPLVMLAAAGFTVSALALGHYAAVNPNSETAEAKSLITPVVHFHPDSSGLAKVSFGYQPAKSVQASDGASLGSQPIAAGQTAQLLLQLPVSNFRR